MGKNIAGHNAGINSFVIVHCSEYMFSTLAYYTLYFVVLYLFTYTVIQSVLF